MPRNTCSREVYLASHHIKTARYGIPIWDAIPDSEKADLPENAKARVLFGLFVHDISKIIQLGWDNDLLFGDRHPTSAEWEGVILPHPDKSREILMAAGIEDELVLDAAAHHHTRDDDQWFQRVDPTGSTVPKYAGYPMGVIGSKFSFHKTFGKAPDAISSMEEERPYRKIMHTPESIVEDISKRSGTEYKPVVVEAFLSLPETVRQDIFHHEIHSKECAFNIETRMRILQAAACELDYLRKNVLVDGDRKVRKLLKPNSILSAEENAGIWNRAITREKGVTPTSKISPEEFRMTLKDFSDFYGL